MASNVARLSAILMRMAKWIWSSPKTERPLGYFAIRVPNQVCEFGSAGHPAIRTASAPPCDWSRATKWDLLEKSMQGQDIGLRTAPSRSWPKQVHPLHCGCAGPVEKLRTFRSPRTLMKLWQITKGKLQR